MQPANLLVVVVLAIFVLVLMAGTRDDRLASDPFAIDARGRLALLTERPIDEEGVSGLQPPAANEQAEFEQAAVEQGEVEQGEVEQGEASSPQPASFPIEIRRPSGPPLIKLVTDDALGRTAEVACSTCHSSRPANLENKDSSSLDEFHQGLKVHHGKLACYACHDPADADSLRSADGTSIPYRDVMTLCSQCHGPQAVSYARGAHGGMSGFWDLSRGPQKKNNCVDCHDPHSPQFPKMIVGFKAIDRFLDTEAPHDDHE